MNPIAVAERCAIAQRRAVDVGLAELRNYSKSNAADEAKGVMLSGHSPGWQQFD
jgi:hypothetical protein